MVALLLIAETVAVVENYEKNMKKLKRQSLTLQAKA